MRTVILLFCGLLGIYPAFFKDVPSICPNIVTRQEWGARDPTSVDYIAFPVDYVIIHHTVTSSCNSTSACSDMMRSIQNYHLEIVDYGDIGYNFLIGGDGKVYEGRGWHKVGAHTYGYNSRSIGISFIGDFTDVSPSRTQLQAAEDLLECGTELGELSMRYKLYGARQVSSTESPGLKLYNKIRKWSHFSTLEKQ